MDGMLGGFGKLTSLDVRDSTAFLAPFFAHKTQPLGTGYALGTLASTRKEVGLRVYVCPESPCSLCVRAVGDCHVVLKARLTCC